MEDIKLEEKVLNQKIKGIFTIIATILINMIIGNSLIWLYLPEKADYYFDDKLKTKKLIVSTILTFANLTKLFFSFYTKYNNIRLYIFVSFFLLMLSHSLLYMFNIKPISIISFIFYGIGVGFPYHQLIFNTCLHFINKKSLILLINQISFNISPVIYYFFYFNTKNISPNGSEIIIFYIIANIFVTLISFDYLRECLNNANEKDEQSHLINNELEYSITDITNNTERESNRSESSINLNNKEKNYFPGENANIARVFVSKRQSLFSVVKDKNIYLIITFFACAIFLSVEKIHKINANNLNIFYLSLFISKVLIYYIFEKKEISPIILKLGPFFVHTLIIFLHSFNSKKEEYFNKFEIILVSISYSLQYCVIHPLLKKIYGEKNAVFLSDFVVNLASSSRWVITFFEIRNSARILTLFFMIISLLFIDTTTFDFNKDSKRQHFGIELKDRNNKIENNEENEDEDKIEDALAIVDVKSDVE